MRKREISVLSYLSQFHLIYHSLGVTLNHFFYGLGRRELVLWRGKEWNDWIKIEGT